MPYTSIAVSLSLPRLRFFRRQYTGVRVQCNNIQGHHSRFPLDVGQIAIAPERIAFRTVRFPADGRKICQASCCSRAPHEQTNFFCLHAYITRPAGAYGGHATIIRARDPWKTDSQ